MNDKAYANGAVSHQHSARLLFGLKGSSVVGMVRAKPFGHEYTRINTNQKLDLIFGHVLKIETEREPAG